jgi:hypothetical protein
MKRIYEKPTFVMRDTLQAVTAQCGVFISPFFPNDC